MKNKLDENIDYVYKKHGVKIIKDEDYEKYMSNENKIWQNTYVKAKDFKSFDGLNLRYYHAFLPENKKNRKVIVIVHGYCGFWGKYHETAHYFWQKGYEVFFLENRGHGYSGRQTNDKDMVHINDFCDYIKDLKSFLDLIVIPSVGNLDLNLFCHSMGGAIGGIFLEKYPNYFKKAIFSSPMFSINTGNVPKFLIHLLRAKIKLFKQENKAYPKGKRFDGLPVFKTSTTRSFPRYNYIFNQRLNDYHYHTYMMSNGWVLESFRATKIVLKNASEVKIPSLLLTAGNDSLVDIDGPNIFQKKAKNVKHIHFKSAKHELFNDIDDVRVEYYKNIFDFLG